MQLFRRVAGSFTPDESYSFGRNATRSAVRVGIEATGPKPLEEDYFPPPAGSVALP